MIYFLSVDRDGDFLFKSCAETVDDIDQDIPDMIYFECDEELEAIA